MARFIKGICLILSLICGAAFFFVSYGEANIPDEIVITPGRTVPVSRIYTVNGGSLTAGRGGLSSVEAEGTVNISVLKMIPVKTSRVRISKRRYVIPGGDIFGIKLYSRGVIVAQTSFVETENGSVSPARTAGLKVGDIILSVDGCEVNDTVTASELFRESGGRTLRLTVMRSGDCFETDFTPVASSCDGGYRAGLWIKDSAAGIGTVTYVDPSLGIFGSLGHAVCDTDTGQIIPVSHGEAVTATVTGCYKGLCGKAGEICGVFGSKHLGTVLVNGETGVFGVLDGISPSGELVPVALSSEVRTGEAEIISTLNGTEKKRYSIKITKINRSDEKSKNLCIEVTDSELTEKSGGIIQGMSGSPIIQNGMLVGAVTHVFVNNPLKGYGIFAENMLRTSDEMYNSNAA